MSPGDPIRKLAKRAPLAMPRTGLVVTAGARGRSQTRLGAAVVVVVVAVVDRYRRRVCAEAVGVGLTCSDRELAHLRDRRHTTHSHARTRVSTYIYIGKRARRYDRYRARVYIYVCVACWYRTRRRTYTYPTLGIAQVGVTWGGAR